MKRECHAMMREMFKNDKQAYIWLRENMGKVIHFSNISEEDLILAHELLTDRMYRKGFIKAKEVDY
jgi:hypothetical protein